MLVDWTADSDRRETGLAIRGLRHVILIVERRADGDPQRWMFRAVGVDVRGAFVSREGAADTKEGARAAAESTAASVLGDGHEDGRRDGSAPF